MSVTGALVNVFSVEDQEEGDDILHGTIMCGQRVFSKANVCLSLVSPHREPTSLINRLLSMPLMLQRSMRKSLENRLPTNRDPERRLEEDMCASEIESQGKRRVPY